MIINFFGLTLVPGQLAFSIIIIAIMLVAVLGSVVTVCDELTRKSFVISLIISIVLGVVCMVGFSIYNTHTASGSRKLKDIQSEWNNGIEREITITAEDGREIFHYEGRVDIETNEDDKYILFDGEDGKRYMIYYGITDTVLIIEK